jgi:hypothetical protein
MFRRLSPVIQLSKMIGLKRIHSMDSLVKIDGSLTRDLSILGDGLLVLLFGGGLWWHLGGSNGRGKGEKREHRKKQKDHLDFYWLIPPGSWSHELFCYLGRKKRIPPSYTEIALWFKLARRGIWYLE